MRLLEWIATAGVVAALAACNPTTDKTAERVPSRTPEPAIPYAPSAPVVPPDPEPPEPTTPPLAGAQQVLLFTGPMDLTIRLSTEDNFATASMTDNSDHTVQMRRVRSNRGVRLEDGEGVVIEFNNGEGTVELVPGKPIEIQEFRLQ